MKTHSLRISTVLLFFILIIFTACGGGGGGSSSSGSTGGGANSSGTAPAHKGPFAEGSTVTAYKLNSNGSRSSQTITTTTTDDKGTFTISVPWVGATELNIVGEYLNETTGTYMSDGDLSAIIDMRADNNNSLGINVLTHIAAQKIKAKMLASPTTNIEAVKNEAKEEVKKQFNLKLEGNDTLEDLDITSTDKPANAQLLQVSAAIMSTANPAEVLNSISSTTVGEEEEAEAALEELKEKAQEVDLVAVAQNIENNLESEVSVPETLAEVVGTLSWDHSIKFEDLVDAYRDTPYDSNAKLINGIIGANAPISIVGGKYSIDGATFTTNTGTINNGQTLTIEIDAASVFNTKKIAVVTIGGVEIPFSVTTQNDPFVADTTPSDFVFSLKRNQELGAEALSDAIIISGINVAVDVSIENGLFDVNASGNYVVSANIVAGSTIRVKHFTANDFSSKVQSTLIIGGVSGTFSSITKSKDTTPNSFSFESKGDVEPNTNTESEVIYVDGINSDAPISVTGGEYKTNGGWTTASGTIAPGSPLTLRNQVAGFGQEQETKVTVGNVVATFTSIAKSVAPDSIPNAFTFGYENNQEVSTSVSSPEITVSGINQEVDITVSTDATYTVNGSAGNGKVNAGDKVVVTHTTAATYNTEKVTTVTIGGVVATFKTITKVEDKTPNAFVLEAQDDVSGGSSVESNIITITGINVPTPVSVTNGTITGGQTTVNAGDTISVTQTASSTQGATTASVLTVGTVTASFITRTRVNAPSISGVPVTSVAEDAEYSFRPTIGASSGKIQRWSITNKPTWAVFNTVTGELSGTPSNDDVGTTSAIVITAHNSQGSIPLFAFPITVTNTNDAPTVEATATTRVAQNETFAPFTVNGTDIDSSDTLTYALSNAPAWMTIDASTGEVSATRVMNNADVGTATGIVVTVTDVSGASTTFTFNVEVTNSNDAPTISGLATTTTNEDAPYSFTPSVSDADVGDSKTFTIANKPSWSIFDATTGTLSGTPSNADVGVYSDINITVTDGAGASDSLAFDLTVANVNDAPVISGLPAVRILEGASYAFIPNVTDDDTGDTKTFTISGNPSWLNINSATGVVGGNSAVVGVSTMIITVTDGAGATDNLTFTVNVENVNDDPVLTTLSNITVDEDSGSTEVSLETIDPDLGAIHFYRVNADASKVSVNVLGDTLTLTPKANVNGTVTITVITNDGKGGTDTKSFDLIINAVNDAPTITGTPVTRVTEGTAYSFAPIGADIDAGTTLSYVIENKPSWATFDATTGTLTGIPSNADVGTTTAIKISVTDGEDIVELPLFNLEVTNVNDAPTITGTPATTVNEDTAYSFTPVGADIDADTTLSYVIENKPTWATFDSATGTLSGTPTNANVGTTTAIKISVTDGTDTVDLPLFNLEVINVNDVPVGTADVATTQEDTLVTIIVLSNDHDDENDTLNVTNITPPTHGTAVVNGTNIDYTPATDYVGTDSFTYTPNDGIADGTVVTVTITITPENDAPVLNTISNVTMDEDTNTTVDLNVTDVDSTVFTYTVTSSVPTLANVYMEQGAATLHIDALSNQNGETNVSVTVLDAEGVSAEQLFTVTVTPVNDAPVTADKNVTVAEDIAQEIVLTATDIDADALTFTVVTNPSHGTVALVDAVVTYTPEENYVGTDSFTYVANDGTVDSTASIVNITITNEGDVPVLASIPNQTVNEDGVALTVELNATDADGDSLTFEATNSDETKASVAVNGTTLTITPLSNANGEINVTVIAKDGTFDSVAQAFTVTIVALNDAPVGISDSANTSEELLVSINVLANDTDVENDTLTVTNISTPNNGTAVLNGINIDYTPNTNFVGADSFTYTPNDGTVDGNTVTVTVTIGNLNDAPTITGIPAITVEEDTLYSFTPVGADIDAGTTLSYLIENKPSWATFDVTTGTLTGTPTNADVGTTTGIKISVTDGTSTTDLPLFNLEVLNVNDAPVGMVDAETTEEDTPLTISVLSNDSDEDYDTLNVTNLTAASHGTATLNGGKVNYVPDADFFGTDTFTYTPNDGTIDGEVVTVTITVTPVNDAPVLNLIGNQTLVEDASALVVELNATDVDNDSITYSLLSIFDVLKNQNVIGGTSKIANVIISGSQLIITPLANQSGELNVTVVASDGTAEDNETILITITPVNDAPTIIGTIEGNVSVGSFFSFIPTAIDEDDSTTLSFVSSTLPQWLEFNSSTGELSGIPMFTDIGEYNITISVSDETNTTSLPVDFKVVDETNITALSVPLPVTLYDADIREEYRDGNLSKTYEYESVLLGADNTLVSESYALENNGSFRQYIDGAELRAGTWVPENTSTPFEVNDEFIDIPSENARVALTGITDISGQDLNISGLSVTMPVNASKYALVERAYGERYRLYNARVNYETNTTYDTLEGFLSDHCERKFITAREDTGYSIGLVPVGCTDSSVREGLLQERQNNGALLDANAGTWIIKDVDGVDILAVYPTSNAYSHDGDRNESRIYAVVNTGSGDAVWDGSEEHSDGTQKTFEMFNEIAIEAIKSAMAAKAEADRNPLIGQIVESTQYFASTSGVKGYRSYDADGSYTGEIIFSDGNITAVSGTYVIDGDVITLHRTSPAERNTTLTYTGEYEGGVAFDVSSGGNNATSVSFTDAGARDTYLNGLSGNGTNIPFTEAMLAPGRVVWNVYPDSNDNTGEHYWSGATFEFASGNTILGQLGLVPTLTNAELNTTYTITANGELTFYDATENEQAYISIVQQSADRLTVCWSDEENATCDENDFEYLYFDYGLADVALTDFNASSGGGNTPDGDIEFERDVHLNEYNAVTALDPAPLTTEVLYDLEYRIDDGLSMDRFTVTASTVERAELSFDESNNSVWTTKENLSFSYSGQELVFNDFKVKYLGQLDSVALAAKDERGIFNGATGVVAHKLMHTQLVDKINFEEDTNYVRSNDNTANEFYVSLSEFISHQKGSHWFMERRNSHNNGGISFAPGSDAANGSGNLVEVNATGDITNHNAGTWTINSDSILVVTPDSSLGYNDGPVFKIVQDANSNNVLLRGNFEKAGDSSEFIWFNETAKDIFLAYLQSHNLPREGNRDDNGNNNGLESRVVGQTLYFANTSGVKGYRNYETNSSYTGKITLTDGNVSFVSGTYSIDGDVITLHRTSPDTRDITLTYRGENSGGVAFDVSSNGNNFSSTSFTSEGARDAYLNSLGGGATNNIPFTQEMLAPGTRVWNIYPETNDVTGERSWEGASFEFLAENNIVAQSGLVSPIENAELDTNYSITADGELTFYDVNDNEHSYISILAQSEERFTICWSDNEHATCNENDVAYLYFNLTTAQTALNDFNSSSNSGNGDSNTSNGGDNNSSNIEFFMPISSVDFSDAVALNPSSFVGGSLYELSYRTEDGLDLLRFDVGNGFFEAYEASIDESNNTSWNLDENSSFTLEGNTLVFDDSKVKYVKQLSESELNALDTRNIFGADVVAYEFLSTSLHDTLKFYEPDNFERTHGALDKEYYETLDEFVSTMANRQNWFMSKDDSYNNGGIAFASGSAGTSGTLIEVNSTNGVVNTNAGTWNIDTGVLYVTVDSTLGYDYSPAFKEVTVDGNSRILRGDFEAAGTSERFIWFNENAVNDFLTYLQSHNLPLVVNHDNGGDNSAPVIPNGFNYFAINNTGAEVSADIDINALNYRVKILSNYDDTPDSQVNHVLIGATVNGTDVGFQIQSTYETHDIVVVVYNVDGQLVGVSSPLTVNGNSSISVTF